MKQMKGTKFFSTMVALLIVAIGIGLTFTSCKDNKEPEEDSLSLIIGKWALRGESNIYTNFDIEFTEDGSYIYMIENKTINGNYKLTGTEKTTVDIFDIWSGEYSFTQEATLYKMLASGSNDFDQLWVYYYVTENGYGQLVVHLYSVNKLVQNLGLCSRYW